MEATPVVFPPVPDGSSSPSPSGAGMAKAPLRGGPWGRIPVFLCCLTSAAASIMSYTVSDSAGLNTALDAIANQYVYDGYITFDNGASGKIFKLTDPYTFVSCNHPAVSPLLFA
jgi:hypothetical protein